MRLIGDLLGLDKQDLQEMKAEADRQFQEGEINEREYRKRLGRLGYTPWQCDAEVRSLRDE